MNISVEHSSSSSNSRSASHTTGSQSPWRVPYDARVTAPKDLLFKVFTGFHRTVYDLSKGKVAGKATGMPVLKLTTVGRKSGERRTTMLTSPLVEGDDVILVASFGGDDRHPSWYLNLVAHPDVEIEIGGSKRLMQARVAEGEERSDSGTPSRPCTTTTPDTNARPTARSRSSCFHRADVPRPSSANAVDVRTRPERCLVDQAHVDLFVAAWFQVRRLAVGVVRVEIPLVHDPVDPK